ncbi:MAG: helix-turn-helix domain-containing protein [Faecalibacterium sp.]
MTESIYKSYDELPLFLNAKTVSQTLGISIAGTYDLFQDENFPALRINNRIVVPKDEFIAWVKRNIAERDS